MTLVLPFVGGSGPSLTDDSAAAAGQVGIPVFASTATPASDAVQASIQASYALSARVQRAGAATADTEHLAQRPLKAVAKSSAKTTTTKKAATKTTTRSSTSTATAPTKTAPKTSAPKSSAPKCPAPIGGSTAGAPGTKYAGGAITGTTSSDLASFATTYNRIRVSHCLRPVPMNHIRYDRCMEQRLVWMAEDPSTDPMSAWGHMGSQRSDGVPSVGCDGNLAGGSGNTGATVATKWWDSLSHRLSLYKPSYTGSMTGVCIYFAMTHGGVPNESYGFTRAAARWGGC